MVLSQKKRSILTIGIIVLGGIASVWSTPAHAVETGGIGAIPANPQANNPRTKSIFVYEAKPSTTKNDAVKIINNTDATHTVKVYAVDSQHSSDGAFACAQAVETKKDVGSWIALQKDEVTLDAGKSEDVPFALTVPANAETGEHNGCIAIEDVKAPKQQMNNGIVLSFRSALRVAVTIPGKIEANLDFINLFITQQKNKLVVSPVLKNTGNVSVDATINVSLNNVLGSHVAGSDGTFVVLNKDETRFNIELDKPFWGGWYTVKSEATYKPLQQTPNSDKPKPATNTTSRVIFVPPNPTAVLIYIVILVAIAGGAGYAIWRRRQFASLHQEATEYKVRPGDNIQTLAEKQSVDWRIIARINHLEAPYLLKTGQIIRLPKPAARNKKNNKSV